MSVQAMMTGARLAYVVRPIPGMVKREVSKWNPKTNSIEKKTVEKPGGFMVYFPRGHVLRLETPEQLKHYNLDQPAQIVNLDGLHDPKSPAGQLLRAQDDKARRGAMEALEDQVVALAIAKSGPMLMPEQLERAVSA